MILRFAAVAALAVTGCSDASVSFPDADGYVQFVNHDGVPNTIYHIRGVKHVEVENGVFIVSKEGKRWVIPQARVVYAGEEFK